MDAATLESPVPPGETERPERRASIRLPCNLPTHCRTLADSQVGGQWVGTLQDISVGGVRLVLSRRFEPGTVLVVEVPDAIESGCTLLARVAWVSVRKNGAWLLGCTWCWPLSAEDLRPLLRPADRAQLAEPRAA